MESTAVETKANGAVAQHVPTGSWGSEGVDRQDLLIPKILLMQGLSESVADGTARLGDMINSVTEEVLGTKDKSVELIPILTFKTWVNFEKVGGKYEYRSVEPMTPANMNDDLEYTKDGTEWRRDRSLNFYFLAASEIPQGDAIPYLVSFRRTSYRAGKKLATHFAKCAMVKAPPAAKSVNLSAHLEKNDLGTYYVFDVAVGRSSTPEELSTAYTWYQTLQKGQHRTDESDLRAAEPSTELSDGAVM